MKRALAMALGAMMVAGSAAPASAASHVDFSGYYRVVYVNDVNNSYRSGDRSFTDSYVMDRLNIDMTFSPTDEIAVHWRFRGPAYDRWGTSKGQALSTTFVYGEIKQDWGTVYVGRLTDDMDSYGLGTLGWAPSTNPIWTFVSPFDSGTVNDGIRFANTWDNGFSLMAQYLKMGNNDAIAGVSNFASDQDFDRYQIEGAYQWDGGGASLNVLFDRNAQGNVTSPISFGQWDNTQAWYVNPAIAHSFGNFSLHFEGKAGWGTHNLTNYNNTLAKSDIDASGYGAYLDADYNYGPGNVNLAAWWVSGTSLTDTEDKSLVSIVDGNFYPLLVAFGGLASGNSRYDSNGSNGNNTAIDFANGAYNLYVNPGIATDTSMFLNTATAMSGTTGLDYAGGRSYNNFSRGNAGRSDNINGDANHWAVMLSGNHAFTDDISMHYAAGYLALNKVNYRVTETAKLGATNWATTGVTEQSKDLGFELDLGFTFQLLDNLKFNTAFGYMFNGDAYKELKGYNLIKTSGGSAAGQEAGDTMQAVWADPKDSYTWYNTLQFDF